MDATGSWEEKAPRPAGNGASQAASVKVEQQPAALPAAAAVSTSSAGAAVKAESGGDEVDDVQVERFYALLANVRALRGMARSDGGKGRTAGAGRKRARDAEPPWRPAFRMEDFAEAAPADAACAGNKRDWGGASQQGGAGTDAVVAGDDEEGEVVVVDARGRTRRRVAARG